jgi:Ca2+-binding EF-hand superfamily protein
MKRSSLHRGSSDIANGVDDCDGDDDGYTASDAEYFRHLKRALRRAFDFFDLDKSDAIEKRELDHILRALGHDVTPKELEAELKRSDLDRNGRLDFYEFVAFVKRQLRCKAYLLTQKREMEIRQAFEALDTDKNGVLDEKEFEYMVFKVLQVELSVEEQDALLDFVDVNGDGAINEEEFIAFMKTMEEFYKRSGGTGPRSMKRQNRFIASLDGTSRLACSAMKKLVRGAPLDIDRNLLMFFDIPTNFRPAISSAATCRLLNANTMAHALSFPSPQVVTALTHSGQRLLDAREPSMLNLIKRDEVSAERHILQQAESFESQAVVSLKRATGVPKPFDTREDDVVKRCVHVCLFQEREEVQGDAGPGNPRFARKMKTTGSGVVVGNIHEVPVYWHPGEEDVWEFSKKTTKEDKYKFLLRTSAVNDRLYLLVEFIVHLRMSKHERRRSKRGKARSKRSLDNAQEKVAEGAREMVCCWCKIPVRDLVTKRPDPMRVREKLWGGTAHAPVDIEQDEILRRRTGWRAVANLFSKPTPPGMGVKSVAIESIPEDLQRCVPKMPPTIIAPFVSLPILAEYMQLMQNMLTTTAYPSSGA